MFSPIRTRVPPVTSFAGVTPENNNPHVILSNVRIIIPLIKLVLLKPSTNRPEHSSSNSDLIIVIESFTKTPLNHKSTPIDQPVHETWVQVLRLQIEKLVEASLNIPGNWIPSAAYSNLVIGVEMYSMAVTSTVAVVTSIKSDTVVIHITDEQL